MQKENKEVLHSHSLVITRQDIIWLKLLIAFLPLFLKLPPREGATRALEDTSPDFMEPPGGVAWVIDTSTFFVMRRGDVFLW